MAAIAMNTPPNFAFLAHLPLWVGWKQESRSGKHAKLPYNPRTGQIASVHDPATWATHDEADDWAAMNGGDGVGLMLSRIDKYFLCAVDLDSCRDPETEAIEPWAQTVIDRLDTYAEASPGGTAVNLFFAVADTDLPEVEALFRGAYSRLFKRADGTDCPAAMEVYRGRRFFPITREGITTTDDLRIVVVSELRWLICEMGPKFAGQSARATGKNESRSAIALRTGVARKPEDATNGGMGAVLLAHEDPEIADETSPEGPAVGEREMRRVSDEDEGKTATDRPTIRLRVGQTERVVDEIEAALIAQAAGSTGAAGSSSPPASTTCVRRRHCRGANHRGARELRPARRYRRRRGPAQIRRSRRGVEANVANHAAGAHPQAAPPPAPPAKSRGAGQLPYHHGERQALGRADPSTGILFDPRGVKFPRVPDNPDKAMAQAALEQVDRLLRTFDFVTQDDKAVARSDLTTVLGQCRSARAGPSSG
jgi:hypothetical protein